MASSSGDRSMPLLASPPRTAVIIAGLAVMTAAGTLLYIHWRQKHGDARGWFEKARTSRPVEKPQHRWKAILADNQPGPFVHLKRPGQDSSEPHSYGPKIRALIADPSELLLAAASAAPPKKPPQLEATEYVWVDRRDQLEQLAAELLTVSEFGVDTEQHSQHSFLGYTALMQISTSSRDYVIDTLALHDHMHLLRGAFSSCHVTKVFHGSDNDIAWLQRDFHIYTVNSFDTYRAAIALDKPQKSLAFLLQCYCGVTTDKRFQKSDWRLRPLPSKLLEYARTDAHYLVYIANCLRAELLGGKPRGFLPSGSRESQLKTAEGIEVDKPAAVVFKEEKPAGAPDRDPQILAGSSNDVSNLPADVNKAADDVIPAQAISLERLAGVVRRSNELCLQLYDKDGGFSGGSAPAAALISRHYATRAAAQRARVENPEERLRFQELVRALCDWRDAIARKEDESVRAVLSDAALVALALAAPKTPSAVLEIVREADRRHGRVNKQPVHPFSEELPTPSPVLQTHVAAVSGITARFAVSLSHSYATLEAELLAPERDRLEAPGSSNVGRNAREPSGWARVDDDSLSKKAHPSKQGRVRDPAAARARFVSKFACKKTVYENCRIYAGDGRLLCYCDRKKLDWYVQKGLADYFGDEPPSITLRFEPKGRPEDENNEFYISSKSNRCVACGETNHYLRFRLVPSCYRQHFPEHLKSHRSHDIVLLCVDCHEVAHKATERHKKLVARKYGVPLIPAKVQRNSGMAEDAGTGTDGVDPDGLRRAATALVMHGSVMPKERVAQLERIVKEYYGKEELTHRDLMNARLIGMGPKGQRRVYKKKGTRLDEQLSDSTPGDAFEEKTGADATGGVEPGKEADGNDGVGNARQAEGLADAREDAGKSSGKSTSGDERAGAGEEADADVGERSVDSKESGTERNAYAEDAEDDENDHSPRGGLTDDAFGHADEENGTVGRNGTGSAVGGTEQNKTLGNGTERNGTEGNRMERNGTARNSTERKGTDQNGTADLEADSDEEKSAFSDGAHVPSERNENGTESRSRRNGITSRRQRAKLRAEWAGGDAELGGERKAVLGHGQHGKRVVEILEEAGGEDALREFAQEWRACFVEALRPTYLPPAWDVKHSGKREFGEFSVYKPKSGEDGEELEG